MRGRCALCLNDSDLQKSHYMPKSVYKYVGKASSVNDKTPIYINTIKNQAVLTNKQFTKHLLCKNCEILFSKNGESIVIPYCAHSLSKFKMLQEAKAGKPTIIKNDKFIYHWPQMPNNINGEALRYFATSIFWRGSVTYWSREDPGFKGALGIKYQEKLRKYLLGIEEFPNEAFLKVNIDSQYKTVGLCIFPHTSKKIYREKNLVLHTFLIPGIRFDLIVSNKILSLYKPSEPVVTNTNIYEWHPSLNDLRSSFKSVEAKGSLALES